LKGLGFSDLASNEAPAFKNNEISPLVIF